MKAFHKILETHILENSNCLYLLVNKQGLIEETNSSLNELVGQDITNKLFKDTFINLSNLSLAQLASENSNKQLLNLPDADNMPVSYYFNVYEEDNKYILIGEPDIASTELLRKNLIEINHELNDLSRELQKKNVELNKLNEEKNKFMGIAAHDLRNPIGVIMGYADFLLYIMKGNITDDQKKMLETIYQTSQYMLNLLEDLLDLSNIESGKLNLKLESLDINEIIKRNIELNEVIAKKKNINIVFENYDLIPKTLFDKNKIEQVLNNLISNAIKYSPENTSTKVYSFISGDNITVAVEDEGQGIPEKEHKLLFQPFTKLSVKATAGEKSTGLGLAIVRIIINGHGGKIWVDSEPGKGSTFYFSLPIKSKTK